MSEEKCTIKFPSLTDQNAWLDFVAEARKFLPDAAPLGFKVNEDYKTWVDQIIQLNLGSKLKEGTTPTTTFFMIKENRILGYLTIKHKMSGNNKIGQVYINIRPSERKKGYGDQLLKTAIQKCKEIGIKEIIITCPSESDGGNKLIINNGGKFVEEKELRGTGIKMNIYSITL